MKPTAITRYLDCAGREHSTPEEAMKASIIRRVEKALRGENSREDRYDPYNCEPSWYTAAEHVIANFDRIREIMDGDKKG